MEIEVISELLRDYLIIFLVIALIALAFSIVYIVALWKLFAKAGEKGWKALIPVYNTYIMVKIAQLNWWYFLIAISGFILSLLNIGGLSKVTTIASLAVNFFIFYNLAKKFKEEPVGYAVAAIFVEPIVTMIFGFSNKHIYDSTITVSPNGPIGVAKENTNTTSSEKYCLGCGQKLSPGVKFCENCGKEVK